jgi:hypothetical protein
LVKETHQFPILEGICCRWTWFFKDLAEHDDGLQYLLTVNHTLTRYAWVCMLKDKAGETVLYAFHSVLGQAGEKNNTSHY